ncbi:hypothetical protein [Bartonella sp. AP14QHHD]
MSDAERFIGNGLIGSFGTMLDFYVSRECLGGSFERKYFLFKDVG